MNLKTLQTKLKEIQVMGQKQIDAFKVTLSMSDLDQKAKDYLYRALDAREAELDKSEVMVENDLFDLKELS